MASKLTSLIILAAFSLGISACATMKTETSEWDKFQSAKAQRTADRNDAHIDRRVNR